MTNLDSVLKSRDITLPTKVHMVKTIVFPVVMYDFESWTIKKWERRRIHAFELWYWKRLLKIPWTARSNQSVLREINPKYSLEGLKPKLKLQYFGHLKWTADSLDKSLMLGKTEGRRRDGWMPSPIQWTWTWANFGRWWGTGRLGWGHKELNMTGWLNKNNNKVLKSIMVMVKSIMVMVT